MYNFVFSQKIHYVSSIVQLINSANFLPKKVEDEIFDGIIHKEYDEVIDLWNDYIGLIN
jgi:hypothetical protein